MDLLERAQLLVEADLDGFVDRSEDPETTSEQLLIFMSNQLFQLRSKLAAADADGETRLQELEKAVRQLEAKMRGLRARRGRLTVPHWQPESENGSGQTPGNERGTGDAS